MTQIIQTDEDLRSVSRRKPLELILVAAPFLLAGSYFLYYALTALVEYALAMPPLGQWLAMLPGLALLLALASAFILPGLYFAASEHVYANRALGFVAVNRQLLILRTPAKLAPIEQISKVIARRESRKESAPQDGLARRTYYLVDVQLDDDSRLQLSELMDKKAAKALAKALSDFIDKPLNDRL